MNSKHFGIISIVAISVIVGFYFILPSEDTKDFADSPIFDLFYTSSSKTEKCFEEFDKCYDLENTLVIFPSFTGLAYSDGGFYDYYNENCDESCLTLSIPSEIPTHYISSQNGIVALSDVVGFPYITDMQLDDDPSILLNYNKIILLHNEYVTKKMFDAITSHPNVIYLYPNALYAEISRNIDDNTITLVRGHGYPSSDIVNGFDWKFDNTHPYEFDSECKNWEFYEIDNGKMLNCFPEKLIIKDLEFLKTILEL